MTEHQQTQTPLIQPVRVLNGHTSQETAYGVDDYPTWEGTPPCIWQPPTNASGRADPVLVGRVANRHERPPH